MSADLLSPSEHSPEIRKLRRRNGFLACTSFIFAIALGWLAFQTWPRSLREASDEDIIFSRKIFQSTKAYVYMAGTLTGDWLAHKNNTYSILCLPDQCLIANVEQIGARQVGRIDGPTAYPVIKWTEDEIVASDNSLCAKITITIDRKTGTLLWVEAPTNQTTIACKNADNTVRKATIEHSLFWQRQKQTD